MNWFPQQCSLIRIQSDALATGNHISFRFKPPLFSLMSLLVLDSPQSKLGFFWEYKTMQYHQSRGSFVRQEHVFSWYFIHASFHGSPPWDDVRCPNMATWPIGDTTMLSQVVGQLCSTYYTLIVSTTHVLPANHRHVDPADGICKRISRAFHTFLRCMYRLELFAIMTLSSMFYVLKQSM